MEPSSVSKLGQFWSILADLGRSWLILVRFWLNFGHIWLDLVNFGQVGPRLPSEQPAAAMVAAAAMVEAAAMAAAAAMAPAGAMAARARAASRAHAAKAPAGAIAAAAAAAAIAAAATIAAATIAAAGCSDGNLGPDFSDANIRQLIPTNPLKKKRLGDTKGFHS